MPSAASSFLLLRFLCRYKENDLLSGNPDDFVFAFEGKVQQKEQQINDLLHSDYGIYFKKLNLLFVKAHAATKILKIKFEFFTLYAMSFTLIQ